MSLIASRGFAQKPALFAANTISTEDDEFGITFSPDGKTCFFTKKTPSTITSSTYVICYSRLIHNKWQAPQLAPFSGKYKDLNPSFSPDGTKLFFISNRPGTNKKAMDGDIWVVKKTVDGWSEPENIGAPVNTPGWEISCSATASGALYFISLNTTTGKQALYRSAYLNDKYEMPVAIGDTANTFEDAADIYVAPDESYLLFSSAARADVLTASSGASAEYPRSDIYISFNKNGVWTVPQNAGAAVNSTAEESTPTVSADGKTLYFTSERNFITIPMPHRLTYESLEGGLHGVGNGLGDIYYMPVNTLLKKNKPVNEKKVN